MDYVAGNFGLNSQLKTSIDEPVSIVAKDFDKNGSIDPILSCYYEGRNYPVFSKDDIQQQLSFLKKRFVKYKDYADLTIEEVFTKEELKEAMAVKGLKKGAKKLSKLGSKNTSTSFDGKGGSKIRAFLN